jgi:hypothetical protein
MTTLAIQFTKKIPVPLTLMTTSESDMRGEAETFLYHHSLRAVVGRP